MMLVIITKRTGEMIQVDDAISIDVQEIGSIVSPPQQQIVNVVEEKEKTQFEQFLDRTKLAVTEFFVLKGWNYDKSASTAEVVCAEIIVSNIKEQVEEGKEIKIEILSEESKSSPFNYDITISAFTDNRGMKKELYTKSMLMEL